MKVHHKRVLSQVQQELAEMEKLKRRPKKTKRVSPWLVLDCKGKGLYLFSDGVVEKPSCEMCNRLIDIREESR